MPVLRAIPVSEQREEAWANNTGTTRVILREPDNAQWRVRISAASVDHEGAFSELVGTRRTLVPLDASMVLRFPDGRELHAARFGTIDFDGAPAPAGQVPDGPTRDFNLMLRGGARAEVFPRTLVDSILLPPETGTRWLVYLHSGRASIDATSETNVTLVPGDAALVSTDAYANRVTGTGEIVLVKLYA